MEVTIDKDRLDFLMYAYFGGDSNPYPASSKRAYRDLCRTLRFHGGSGEEYRAYIDGLLERRIVALLLETLRSQKEYDSWHHALCNEMVEYYKNKDVVFNIGHAQKWINMIMKYLFIQGDINIAPVFEYLHVPIDQYIITVAEQQLSIPRPCAAWSKITDYGLYLRYQKQLRAAVGEAPMRWEFQSWLSEATNKKSDEYAQR